MKFPKWVWSSSRLYAPVNRTFFRRFPKSLYKNLMGSDPITKFLRCRQAQNFRHILASKKGGRTGTPPSDDRLCYPEIEAAPKVRP